MKKKGSGQISVRRKCTGDSVNWSESYGDWKTILSFFVFSIFSSKYHYLCFFNFIRIKITRNWTFLKDILTFSPSLQTKDNWKWWKYIENIKLSTFLLIKTYSKFWPPSGGPCFRCLRHRGCRQINTRKTYLF